MAKLVVLNGNKIGQDFSLPNGPVTIGRGLNNTIILPDESVSMQHILLLNDADGCRVKDRTSANGTLVNGQPIAMADLKHGDVLRIGDIELRFISGAKPPTPGRFKTPHATYGAREARSRPAAPVKKSGLQNRGVRGPRFEDVLREEGQKKRVVTVELPLFQILTWGGTALFLAICVYVYWPRKAPSTLPYQRTVVLPAATVKPPPPLGFIATNEPPPLPYSLPVGAAPAGVDPAGQVHRVSRFPNAQAALEAARPGDAVVFDSQRPERVTVARPLEDLQFIGGGAEWDVRTNLVNCQFWWHTPISFVQSGGRLERCAFYQSHSPVMLFNHADAVSLYYGGMEVNPASSQPHPQVQLNGFIRGVTIHKPVIGRRDLERVWNMNWPPVFRLHATDLSAHGHNTYFLSPLVLGQTAWTPFQVVRATGVTFAHGGTEENTWASPVLEVDYGIDCAVLATAFGGRMGASGDGYLRQPDKLNYFAHVEWGHNHASAPFRDGAVRLAGQRNKIIGLGDLQRWSVGLRATLPGFHLGDGVIARDPFLQEWAAETAGMSVNLAEPVNVFKLDWSVRASPNPISSSTNSRVKFPLLGPNVARPVLVALGDLRAPPPTLLGEAITDLTGQPAGQILNTLDAGKIVYLGPGKYAFNRSITRGMIIGAGMERTILEWPATEDCAQRACRGLVNLTVKGGRHGYNSQLGNGGATNSATALFLRTRFDGQKESGVNFHSVVDQGYQDCEFVNARNGITQGRLRGRGVWVGERGIAGGRHVVRLNLANCTFRNLLERAVDLTMNEYEEGVVGIHNCRFEDIKGQAIKLHGGKSHLIQQCRFERVGPANYPVPVLEVLGRGVVVASHLEIKNTPRMHSTFGMLVDGIATVSHCEISGCDRALASRNPIVVDHTRSEDGRLELPFSSLVFVSAFANADVTKGAMEVQDFDKFKSVSLQSAAQPLDTTPPPDVGTPVVRSEGGVNVLHWTPVKDRDSGINQYIVYAHGMEIGRTVQTTVVKDLGHRPMSPPVQLAAFRDVNVTNREYLVKAINGANLLSGGGQAALFGWGPLRGLYRDKSGADVVIQDLEYRVKARTLRVTSPAGRNYSAPELEGNGLPAAVYLEPGVRREMQRPVEELSGP